MLTGISRIHQHDVACLSVDEEWVNEEVAKVGTDIIAVNGKDRLTQPEGGLGGDGRIIRNDDDGPAIRRCQC